MNKIKPRLLLVVNVDWFFVSHRLPIAVTAIANGYDVYLAAKETDKREVIEANGIRFIDIRFNRSGTKILNEIKTIISLYKIIKSIKPDIIHNVTIKANVYGTIASRLNKVPKIVNAISGLGYNFTNENRPGFQQKAFLRFLRFLYNSKKVSVIFQNSNDCDIYLKNKVIKNGQYILIKGSGVDLNDFAYFSPHNNDKIKFLFSARLLLDKGIIEYIDAAKIFHDAYPDRAEFIVAGSLDKESPIMVNENILIEAHKEGVINYVGFVTNMINLLKEIDVAVLPSYYGEGVPKALIEAAAIGRPIITTDMPGCRDTVINGKNGYLVNPKDSHDLADKMMLLLDSDKRVAFGLESRKLAKLEFSIDNVIHKTFNLYNS